MPPHRYISSQVTARITTPHRYSQCPVPYSSPSSFEGCCGPSPTFRAPHPATPLIPQGFPFKEAGEVPSQYKGEIGDLFKGHKIIPESMSLASRNALMKAVSPIHLSIRIVLYAYICLDNYLDMYVCLHMYVYMYKHVHIYRCT